MDTKIQAIGIVNILINNVTDGNFCGLASAALSTALAVIERRPCCAVYRRRNAGAQDNK